MRTLSILFALTLAASCLAQDFAPPNVVQNPGFETLGANGLPEAWGANGTVFTSAEGVAHSGERSLRYSNEDAGKYILCSQTIPLEPGIAYEFSGWIKTENVKGEDNGATICLEWYAEDGKYLGGSYPAGFKGTTDWRQLRATGGRVPPTAAKCTVTCYLRKGCTGTAWWDDIEVRKFRYPALRTTLIEPNYRGQVTATTKRIAVAADLNLRDYGMQPEQVLLKLSLKPAAGGDPVRTATLAPESETLVAEMPADDLAPGKYSLETTLTTADGGQQLGADSWRVHVLTDAEAASRTSYIDEHNRLIVDGKPFFPLGMYWGGISAGDLETYADSAFNCLMPYGGGNQEQMALLEKHNLKIIYTLKDVYYGSTYCPKGIETIDDERRFIEAKVAEYGNHPAVIGWYLNDELSTAYMDRLEAHQEWMEELDPNHPTWVVLYQVGEIEQYRKTFDVIGTDPYPIPGSPAARAAQWTRMTVDAMHGARPVWMVPQVFNWAVYRKTEEEKKGLRPPTLDEMRSMSWQCIAEGAQGLIYYSFMDIKRDPTVPFEEQWGHVKTMAAEIAEMIPVILSVEKTPEITADEAPWINWMLRSRDGVCTLIAVNNGPDEGSHTFRLPSAPKSVKAVRGDNPTVEGTTMALPFKPFEVQIVELTF
ncbi:MAG: carbohydrate binding domain-containing protein [Acidobacteriota bacterium]|nr:carbohydrate binding domain-containing protein [Acidobacteriota bacterium]